MENDTKGVDSETSIALALSADQLRRKLNSRAEFFAGNGEMIAAMAARIETDYLAALESGRRRVLMIVPVGPIGQYEILAGRCRNGHLSLDKLTLLIMDEYLTDSGNWISEDDPLSFRGHLRRNLLDTIPEEARPRLVVPSPQNPGAITTLIDDLSGVDFCYAGVGITGHLAFNDPLYGVNSTGYFARLPTRVVALSPETRLINAVTAARGNVSRIPRMAVTVGMREILGATTLRIYMNRDWQCAAIRRLACGPVTAAFPASLVQSHANWSLHVVENVLRPPEPELR